MCIYSLGGIPIPPFQGTSEDCLYLDIFVPAKAIKYPNLKLPVVVYIFGGGYLMGSKDPYQPSLPFYDGSGMIDQSGGNIIFVSFNYRLGTYGWLAGTTMEKTGLPNAGLWDQRAVFQWVRDHISKVGGDPMKVTAMGESAGAGSIMHHLVAKGGTLDPLFQRAILMSPAFEPIWDRAGVCENTFKTFEKLAGCEGKGLQCLRAADAATIAQANDGLMDLQAPGSFAVGPTPDGDFIRQLPALELSTGNFWKLESLLQSHCAKESVLFVSGAIGTNDEFSNFVGSIFPNYTRASGILDKVLSFYPPVEKNSKYRTQSDRVEAFLRDSSFTCNIRYLTEAFGDKKVWNMQYSVAPGWHGTDIFAAFYNSKFTSNSWTQILGSFALLPLGIMYSGISWAMQSYFTSYVINGDPNKSRTILNLPPTIGWDHPNSGVGETVSGVVDVGNWFYSTVNDDQMGKTACDFWHDFSKAVTLLGGYEAPGTSFK
jgi:carboxylesterase type B